MKIKFSTLYGNKIKKGLYFDLFGKIRGYMLF